MKKAKEIIPYPFAVYFWTCMGIAVAGLMDAVYLSISHYRVYTDMSYRSFCAVTKSINCDTVSQSPYAIMLDMPLPLWGVFGYLFVIMLIWIGRPGDEPYKAMWPLVFIVSVLFSLHSLVLAYISSFIIHSYCLMCILSYCVNFLLLFYSWLIHRRFNRHGIMTGLKQDLSFLAGKPFQHTSWMGILGVGFMVVWFFLPRYWLLPLPDPSADIATGYTHEGDPWIGAAEPELTIVEFTDYRCFQCRKMHFYLRHIVSKNPHRLRLVHKHFPMDHDFNPLVESPLHVGAGRLALLSIYAAEQGKFWEMNDILFNLNKDIKEINMKELAKRCHLNEKGLPGSLKTISILSKLEADIREGLSIRIQGTPGYVIEEKVYTGQIPPEILTPYL